MVELDYSFSGVWISHWFKLPTDTLPLGKGEAINGVNCSSDSVIDKMDGLFNLFTSMKELGEMEWFAISCVDIVVKGIGI